MPSYTPLSISGEIATIGATLPEHYAALPTRLNGMGLTQRE
jgi:hypothetical protein